MLGIRLDEKAERRLERYAREIGRPKSVVVRDWIIDRLDREDVDAQVRRAAELHASRLTEAERRTAIAASDAFSAWLDAEDGGYEWGPNGPPPTR